MPAKSPKAIKPIPAEEPPIACKEQAPPKRNTLAGGVGLGVGVGKAVGVGVGVAT
jgi:hypothetical protein